MADEEVGRLREAYGRRAEDDRYGPNIPEQIALLASRNSAWATTLRRAGHGVGRTLEIGSGGGPNLRWAIEVGASVAVGVDVLFDRLLISRMFNPRVVAANADGRALPFPSGAFDTVVLSTVCSSILDDEVAAALCREVARVLDGNGVVLWFDFWRDSPGNADVRGIARAKIAEWFPGWTIDLQRVVLAPPLARRLRAHPHVRALLEALPPLRTHLAGTVRR